MRVPTKYDTSMANVALHRNVPPGSELRTCQAVTPRGSSRLHLAGQVDHLQITCEDNYGINEDFHVWLVIIAGQPLRSCYIFFLDIFSRSAEVTSKDQYLQL